ncbi:MAG: nucleotide triphosphate diphosphatase NUDT15 [Candidatus Saccharibacteria bacterium]
MEMVRPGVGIGVMIFKEGKVLLGKRKNKLGLGQYAWPGGKLEMHESIEDCARRETREEAGIEIKNVRFLRLMNFIAHDGSHFADIGIVADWESGEPIVMEPEKCEGWEWYEPDPEKMPKPLFATLPSYFEAMKTGRIFFDS